MFKRLRLLMPRRWPVRVALALGLLLAPLIFGFSYVIHQVGGASSRAPQDLGRRLSPEARKLVERAWAGITPSRLMDYHTHVVGLGAGGTGCSVNSHMRSWWHPMARVKFLVYASAAGITDFNRADQQYVDRLASLVSNISGHGRQLILAFDSHHNRDGTINLSKTEFHVPNSYVIRLSKERPQLFVPAISVHPARADAVAELERGAAAGARFVKWLPNAMGIDPSEARWEPFYQAMKRLDMVLLSHAGEEKAVEAEEDQKLGNPLLLRRPLDQGVKVVVAHCASLGRNEDLDHPEQKEADNFHLFMRLMEQRKYRGLLFGEVSAMIQFNRLAVPIKTMLRRKDLHHRLVNGSDFPLPAINVIVRTRDLVSEGLISESERGHLNEIYDFNPLLFDFVTKRVIQDPVSKNRFPPEVFMIHPELDPARSPQGGR